MTFKFFGKTYEIKKQELPALSDDSGWISYLAGAGYEISSTQALKVAAVFRCIDIISKTIASLPLFLMKETAKGKEKAREHQLFNLVYSQPNRHTTAYEFWQMYVANLLLMPKAVAKIERDRRGYITGLWNIPTSRVSDIHINNVNGERYLYVTLNDGSKETLRDGEFISTPSFMYSNKPENPLKIASEVLGLSRDLTRYAQSTFSQGVNPGGFIESPAGLSDNAYSRLKDDFNKNYAGVVNAGKFIILEEGTKANIFTRDMEKTQNLESRKFAIQEVCRIFGVPPHLCMDMENATFSNIEQQSLEFVRDCINPLTVRLEQTLSKDLLTNEEKQKYYFHFNLNGLMRADFGTRMAGYATARQNGWMSANDIRELEDMNRIPADEGGDAYLCNGNMISLEYAMKNKPRGLRE